MTHFADEVPKGKQEKTRDAYPYLNEQGVINFGILRDDPNGPKRSGANASGVAGASGQGGASEGAPPAVEVSDELLAERLNAMLAKADMTTTTEKMLRGQLEAEFGVDLKERKKYIRTLVSSGGGVGCVREGQGWRGGCGQEEGALGS